MQTPDDVDEIGLICINGHVVNSLSTQLPNQNKKFYPHCGVATVNKCPHCNSWIRRERFGGYASFGGRFYSLPDYCEDCKVAFPWTAAKLESTKELIRLSELSEDEKREFIGIIPDLVLISRQSSVAVLKAKNFLRIAGSSVGARLQQIIVEIAAEATKRSLQPYL
ncbi:MAG: DUF2321 domain-containing protein [Ignavibacteriota bacterium]